MDTQDIIKILNYKLFESDYYEHDYFSYLKYVESPIGDYIEYMGHCIWDSENDYRDRIDDETQEPLDTYLIKQIKLISDIAKRSAKVLEN